MKLYVDDIRNAPDESWTVARTITEAVRTIAWFGEQIKEISLDHDISHQVTVGGLSRPYPCEETFATVARYIVQRYKDCFDRPKVTLHTSNPVGAQKMAAILRECGIEPEIKLTGAVNRLEMEV